MIRIYEDQIREQNETQLKLMEEQTRLHEELMNMSKEEKIERYLGRTVTFQYIEEDDVDKKIKFFTGKIEDIGRWVFVSGAYHITRDEIIGGITVIE